MDWYLDGAKPEAVSTLRHELLAYLTRHAEPGSDLDAAELLTSEAVGNAVRHASGPVWVSLSWQEAEPTLTVHDLGPGFDPGLVARPAAPSAELEQNHTDVMDLPESGRGLLLLGMLATDVQAAVRAHGGMVVSVRLPVRRSREASHDAPRRHAGALPDPSEAQPGGGFGRESFLRALVVQMAQTVELEQGPDEAEAVVSRVGIDVGGQIEDEFRLAKRVVDRMTPEQLAACFVRLKHAIDGDFYVIEADERRIVLGNRRCPFGPVVQRAPALSRMTSSVFGGIAARNSEAGRRGAARGTDRRWRPRVQGGRLPPAAARGRQVARPHLPPARPLTARQLFGPAASVYVRLLNLTSPLGRWLVS